MKRTFILFILLALLAALIMTSCDKDGGDTLPSTEEEEGTLTPPAGIDKVDLSKVRFPDTTVYYDGTAQSIQIRGTLPSDVRVEYEGNEKVPAGIYTVTAKFYYKDYYIEGADKSANMIIEKATISTSAIKITQRLFAYDGTPHGISLTNVPRALTPVYIGNDNVEVGTYTVTVEFEYDKANYNEVSPLTFTMVIAPDVVTYDGVTFKLLESGNYEITSYLGDREAIVIPSEYNGVTVSSIGSGAFMGNEKINYLFLPDTIINVGAHAFAGCNELRTIVSEANLTTIGSYAFRKTAIKSICLPDTLISVGLGAFAETDLESITVPFIGSSVGSSNRYFAYIFGAGAYGGGSGVVPESLREVIISDAATEIPAYAFFGLGSIESIRIGAGVNTIGNCAFFGCQSLLSIRIPKSVTNIYAAANAYDSPFFGCTPELQIILEGEIPEGYGAFWANVSEDKRAKITSIN